MSWFGRALLAIVFVVVGVRIGYVLIDKHDEKILGDQIDYNAQVETLAVGGGFTDFRDDSETAEHPPLTALAVGRRPRSGSFDDDASNRLAHCLTTAVFGRRRRGDRARRAHRRG